MSEPVIKFEHLIKNFDNTAVIKGITTEVKTGEVIGLLGLNGAGKTTLLEVALGFSLPTSGSSLLWGIDSAQADCKKAKARIGFVPQQDELMGNIDGERYLNLLSGFYETWNKELVERLALEWEIPMTRTIKIMSVGQRQKLSILAALAHEPDLLILDEPVASLDPVARRLFLTELIDIASSNTRTILFSTHIVTDLERVASRVWLMKDGQLIINEELDQLKERNARIHLPLGEKVSESFMEKNGIHSRMVQDAQILFIPDCNDTLLEKLEKELGQKVSATLLSLEDIFLELHQ